MRREQILARLLRAVSGKSQEQFGREAGIHPSLVAQFELGRVVPSREHLKRMAKTVELTLSTTEEALRFVDTLRRPRLRRGAGAAGILDGIAQGVRSELDATCRRLLALPPPAAVHIPGECWSWALCERACEASVREASRNVERAAAWARLARRIAERVQAPEPWRDRLRGYAEAHVANVLRVAGDLASAEATLEEAKRLWHAGSDPAGLLDPGRLLDLEASLRRAQRRLPEALALLDQAAAVGHRPERALLQKGYTLEVMGEYERAVETLLRAVPLVIRRGDPRLESILSGNLALSYCHLGRFAEAAELAGRVRATALETGDEIEALRMTWIEGRIAAGLGRTAEARGLLAQARRELAARGMEYDAALALLEESALLLDEGRAAEVKALARELASVFGSKGVHREALAALRLFQEAVEREHATAELARRVLGYLFRARHDSGLGLFTSALSPADRPPAPARRENSAARHKISSALAMQVRLQALAGVPRKDRRPALRPHLHEASPPPVNGKGSLVVLPASGAILLHMGRKRDGTPWQEPHLSAISKAYPLPAHRALDLGLASLER